MSALATAPARRRPFRLERPRPLETDTHEAIWRAMQLLVLPPWFPCCYPAGHIQLTGQQAAKLARVGLVPSLPDFLVFCPDGERPIGIEVKRIGGQLSHTRLVRTRSGGSRLVEGQREVFDRLQPVMRIAIVESVDGAIAALERMGVALRARAVGMAA